MIGTFTSWDIIRLNAIILSCWTIRNTHAKLETVNSYLNIGQDNGMIEQVISLVQQTCSPGELDGYMMDMDEAFWSHSAFRKFDITSSTDPYALIRVRATIAPCVRSVQEIANAFKKINNKLGYNDFKSTSLYWYNDATVFRFVTVMSDHNVFVTGMAVASGRQYKRLVADYNTDFGDMGGRLEPYPGGLPDWALQKL